MLKCTSTISKFTLQHEYGHKYYISNNFKEAITEDKGALHCEGYDYEEFLDEIFEAPLSGPFFEENENAQSTRWFLVVWQTGVWLFLHFWIAVSEHTADKRNLIFKCLAITPMLVLELLIVHSTLVVSCQNHYNVIPAFAVSTRYMHFFISSRSHKNLLEFTISMYFQVKLATCNISFFPKQMCRLYNVFIFLCTLYLTFLHFNPIFSHSNKPNSVVRENDWQLHFSIKVPRLSF